MTLWYAKWPFDIPKWPFDIPKWPFDMWTKYASDTGLTRFDTHPRSKKIQKVDRTCNHPSYHVHTMLTPDAGKKCQLHPTSERLGKSAWEQQVFPPNIQLQSSGNFPNIKHQWISLLASNLISLPQVPGCHPTHSGNLRRPPTNCYSQSLVGSTVPLRNYLAGITQGI